jgi:hypothetical protein
VKDETVGECLIQVPVRLTIATAQRMDGDVKRFPFCEGRSAIGRKLIELAYDAIDAGIIEFEPGTLQEVQSNLRQRKNQSVPSVPRKR